ncbi:MAG TPA: SDR family oxidoreductase [Chitinophagaceae bacterium]
MRVIIFGATGNVGKQLTFQALAQEHQVTAFTRNKEKLHDIRHNNFRIVSGDVLDYPSVLKAVKEHDAVLCSLGAGRKGVVRSQGTKNILRAMNETGVRRIICQTTLGCGESWNNLNFFWKRIMFGWFLKEAFADHELQEKYVMESDVDWTIVRPGAFVKGALTGNYRHGFPASDHSVTLKISPPDVAMFMLDQLASNTYLRKAPGLSY